MVQTSVNNLVDRCTECVGQVSQNAEDTNSGDDAREKVENCHQECFSAKQIRVKSVAVPANDTLGFSFIYSFFICP